MIPIPSSTQELVRRFGDPMHYLENKRTWEGRMAIAALKTSLPYAYSTDGVASQTISSVRGHEDIVTELADLLQACLDDGVPPSRMPYGGCYVFRARRGGTRLSLHTWGLALDLDPAKNPLGEPWADDGIMLDSRIVSRFEGAGWIWGGRWHHPDPMHLQRAGTAC